jgi:hypothetical protein
MSAPSSAAAIAHTVAAHTPAGYDTYLSRCPATAVTTSAVLDGLAPMCISTIMLLQHATHLPMLLLG